MSRNHFTDCFTSENSIVAVYTSAREKTAILSAVSTPISFSAHPIALRHLQAFNIIIGFLSVISMGKNYRVGD